MTKKYNQLTLQQRYKIEALKSVGTTQTQIAEIIGVHKSTISREFRRNIPRSGINADKYIATRADQKTRQRHKEKYKPILFNDQLKHQAREWMINKCYSPEFISAQWRKDEIKGVSHETLYKFIWDCKHSQKRWKQRVQKPL